MQTPVQPDSAATDALVRQSQDEREEASHLLDELRLLEQWQQYGDIEVGGSYRSDLMLRSDLDLFVVNPAADVDLALHILSEFVRQGDFLRFGFIDSVRGMPGWADHESFPRGYMLGMAREFHGREWKVETWLLAAPAPRPDWIEERMTEEGRRTILQLKHQRNSREFYASSYDIYRAVLLGGANTAAQAQEWLRSQKEPRQESRPPSY